VVVTAREFAKFWESRGYPSWVVNPITKKLERPAFVTLWSGPGEDDTDPPDDDETQEAA
jgi:hypothetical protein